MQSRILCKEVAVFLVNQAFFLAFLCIVFIFISCYSSVSHAIRSLFLLQSGRLESTKSG